MHIFLLVFTHIINLVFPEECLGCKKNGTLLCDNCLDNAPRAEQPVLHFITALFDYHDTAIQRAIWRLKYRNARAVSKCFGRRLYEGVIGDLSDSLLVSKSEIFLLVPVPLHNKRLRERGYNQSELLAREIIKCDTENIFQITPNALIRTRETKTQVISEKRTARLENLHGAFRANASIVRKREVILIDDVTTTGATLAEARRALISAGARSVRAYTVAH